MSIYQTATVLPSSSSDQGSVIAAAESRASFWRYPSGGPWTCPVSVGNKTVQVHRDQHGSTTVHQPSK